MQPWCSKWGEGYDVVKNGNFQPTTFCQIYPQACSSDITDTIAKELGSLVAWLTQTGRECLGGLGGSLSPDPCNLSGCTSWEIVLDLLLPEGGHPWCPPNCPGSAGAFRAQAFDAGFSFVCLWDNPHQKFGGRCPHVRVAVGGRESTVC
eukprot:1136630-Pelagomonas_calceolata.AAC.9